MAPLVSINLCCYNSEKYLRETLQSIINQTYTDWELVIINDGSSDSTESIIHEYIKQGYPIIYHYQENKGLGYSRNEALKRSQGEFIAFIDHDDLWMPEKLEKQVTILESDEKIALVYSNFIKYNTMKGTRRTALKGAQPEKFAFPALLKKYSIGIMTVVIRYETLKNLDHYFDESLNLSEDYDLFLRIAYKSNVAYINEPLALYRIHENMSSLKHFKYRPDEKTYILNKLLLYDPEIPVKYKEAFFYAIAKNSRSKAISFLLEGDTERGKKVIAPFKFIDVKFFIIFLISSIPSSIYRLFSNLVRRQIIKRGV